MTDIINQLREEILSEAYRERRITDFKLAERLVRERLNAADEIERLRATLERIADTDPDDGTSWFHNVANTALERKP